ncbi:MAG: Hint domain-containing protein [Arenibacterium sp.]
MGFPLPDTGAVTEDTGVVGGFLTASGDADFGPFFNNDAGNWVAETIAGIYGSSLSIDADGVWTYTADNANGAIQALNTGETLTEVFTVSANTGFGLQTTTITITINGQDEVPCFVSGTLIETAHGPQPIETLKPGDQVLTRDNGLQPIRWVGGKRISLTDPNSHNLRPIRLRKNSLAPGVPDRDIMLSPMHRVRIRDPVVELLCSQPEVFCPAHRLVNGRSITWETPETVDYHHLMFDQHQVVMSSGCESESFYPGDLALNSLEPLAREELLTLFPDLRSVTGALGDVARPIAKGFEAELLARHLTPKDRFLQRLRRRAA